MPAAAGVAHPARSASAAGTVAETKRHGGAPGGQSRLKRPAVTTTVAGLGSAAVAGVLPPLLAASRVVQLPAINRNSNSTAHSRIYK